ncbi:MAG: ABC transporter permease subunit [bacterium]|nr:ABC transporter permease subunit [bacterium]
MDRRRAEERLMVALMIGSAVVMLGTLCWILAVVLVKGLPAMRLSMLIRTPSGGFYLGREGGILNAIVGSLLVAGGATALAALVAVPVVVYINLYARPGSWIAVWTRFSFDVLWGVPSIVYGAFGFALMLRLGVRASLLGGILTVACLVLPIMCRAMDEVIRLVPGELADAAAALGATRLQTALGVVARQAMPGLVTAVLIAFGRGIGDAASVLFTAGFSDAVPTSLFRPAATLPLAIFFQLGTPFPEVQERAYASALILTAVILAVSAAARALAGRSARHIVR